MNTVQKTPKTEDASIAKSKSYGYVDIDMETGEKKIIPYDEPIEYEIVENFNWE